jgi:hypothetical protein
MGSMLGDWKFWAAVIIVVAISHFIMGFVMPKVSGGGS